MLRVSWLNLKFLPKDLHIKSVGEQMDQLTFLESSSKSSIPGTIIYCWTMWLTQQEYSAAILGFCISFLPLL